MKFIMRFYGSCSHIEDTESKELFDKYSAPRKVKSHSSDKERTVQSEVTEENGAKIVHVHPDRYSSCHVCMMRSMEIDLLEYKDKLLRKKAKLIRKLDMVNRKIGNTEKSLDNLYNPP